MSERTAEIEQLNEAWAQDETARFVPGRNGLPMLACRTPLAEADVYLQGGHVTHYQPTGEPPLLYLSPRSRFAPAEPIRGGVPICFPWFAQHADRPDLPMHGLARVLPWRPIHLQTLADGEVQARFALDWPAEADAVREATADAFPQPFRLTLSVTVGTTLRLALEIENTGDQPLPCEVALHSYLAVSDVRRVQLLGLENSEYLDKTDHFRRKTQPKAPVVFTAETDRIYLDTAADCRLIDVPAGRHVLIEKSGSRTTVVWNPWVDKARRLDDLKDDDWHRLVCVETANVAENALRIAPGAAHTVTTTFSTQPIRTSPDE